jgi:hypothetical protein
VNGRFFVVVFLMLFGVLAVFNGAAWAGGNVNFMYGHKSIDEVWEPVEEQSEYGLMIDFKAENWPLSIALDLLFSDDSSDGFDGETRELSLGVRKYFSVNDRFKPYVGGGLVHIYTEYGYSGYSDDDAAVGIWLSGGVLYTIAERLNIGVDLRYSDAEVTMWDLDVEAGGSHLLLFAGIHF